jgi:leader peptidase (prepilin peptidase)/N-methyltransferase
MTSWTSTSLLAALAGVIAAVSFVVLPPLPAAVSTLLGWTMLAIAAIDAQRFIIPDVLSLPAIPAGLLASPLIDEGRAASSVVLEHVGAAIVGAVVLYAIRELYYVLRRREGLGLGDVKLAGVAGAWSGFVGLAHTLLLACVLAIVAVLLMHVRDGRALRGSTAIAFGVFLAPSIWLVWCLAALGIDPASQWPFAT